MPPRAQDQPPPKKTDCCQPLRRSERRRPPYLAGLTLPEQLALLAALAST